VLCAINLGLTLDSNAARLDPLAFTPADSMTYTHSASITLNDIVGIQRLVTLYFVATDDAEQSWYTYLSIDGEQLDIINGILAADDYRAGQLFFNDLDDLNRVSPDRFRSPGMIFDDNRYEHQFIITIDPTTTQLGAEYAISVGVPGCELE
jgi:flagellar hook protein FlgE